MKNINIDDGREGVSINGDPERVIYIQPSDYNLQLRAKQSEKKISEFLSELDSAVCESDEAYADLLEKIDSKVREQINYLFNYDVSDVVFGLCSPLTSLKSGKCYLEEFMDAIMPVIKASARKAAAASEKRIAKHTARYTE